MFGLFVAFGKHALRNVNILKARIWAAVFPLLIRIV